MFTLSIVRVEKSKVGKSKSNEIFRLSHTTARVPNESLAYLLDNSILQGGDIVTCKRDNKVVRQYYLCDVCCKRAAKDGDRCDSCNATVAHISQHPGGDKVIEGIIESIKARNKLAEQTSKSKEYSPRFSFIGSNLK